MNEQKNNISMERFAWYITVVILLLCGVTFLLSSCITEGLDGPNGKKGPKAVVTFALNIGSYGNEEKVETRSAKSTEILSNVFRVATDVYMYATLEEEHPVVTRAPIALNNGAQVRIVAYSGAPAYTTVAGYADYTIAGGALVPVTAPGLSVPTGATYKFAAYSFNDATTPLPDHTGVTLFNASSLSNPNDLLWGITNEIPIPVPSGLTQPVELVLNHLFARIKVEASTIDIVGQAVNISLINGARVSPSFSNLYFNAATGKLTPINPNVPENLLTRLTRWRAQGSSTWLTPPAPLNAQEVESDYFLIYTNESDTISLFIDNLVVNDGTVRDLGNYQFRFSNVGRPSPQFPLIPGNSYVLTLNFQRQIWAGSNIFWDGTKLTFLPETTPPSAQGYQGVYFMWGSLIGISPSGGTFDVSTTKLYVPPIARSNWSTQYAGGGFANDWTGANMQNIPRVTGGTLVSPNWLDNHTSRNYLSAEVHDPNGAIRGTRFIGDICKYLSDNGYAPLGGSGRWRMPNAREFGLNASEYSMVEFRNFSASQFVALDDGTYNLYPSNPLQRSYVLKSISSTVFPDGLSRTFPGGAIDQPTRYLSGSPTSANPATAPNVLDACYNMFIFGSDITYTTNQASLGTQGLVRCLKLDGGGIPINWITPTVNVEDWDIVGTPFGQGDTNGQGNVQY